jgi:diphosphomevalonate decarboxylase
VRRCLDLVRSARPGAPHARVVSSNSFPTAAGLASSASGFAALVVAADRALGIGRDPAELADLARRCSGSAARSIYGGFVELRLRSDGSGTDTASILAASEWPLRVVIAIASTSEKEVGSTAGMRLSAETSPYYSSWVNTSEQDLDEARQAIARRDFSALAAVSEHSCLKMHAAAMAARPGLLYWNGTTVDCLLRVRELARSGQPVFFTIDAGPQVKAVCLPEAEERVATALAQVPGVREILRTGLGDGARLIED